MIEELLKFLSLDNGIFIFISLLGLLGHAFKKYLSGQLSGSIVDYLFLNNPKRTVLAMLTTIASAVGLIVGEQIPVQAGAFIMLAFTTGFSVDSTLNRDE